ncbi:lysine-specific demethylase JMJ31 isoform X2 [Cryptomeria japonica]|uniref:lysine-specific demethylase JMJ31 isoform X2 n=1 Tax=Cryptomeria japonica TaxID=3369 RepID=UPI0027DA44B2|nr:lysine-specific demethylase JMJ31 isoform X2 [Cryptomeria japonica]
MEKWTVARFEHMPCASEFSSQIEPHNMPVVFGGCVADWDAINKWNPNTGGLHHLQMYAGSSTVEAMLSRLGSIFYGDIRGHDRISLSFSTFINLCKKSRGIHSEAIDEKRGQDGCHMLEDDSNEGLCSYLDAGSQIYLAQVPLFNKDKKGESPLAGLLKDINTPRFLDPDVLSSINLWMNVIRSRSSTHYDPHHNLLCVVAGRKQVVLWPPSAAQFLYPMPVCGEASNHSAVNLIEPDLEVHPRAKYAWDHCQKVELNAGDALFIPEGWFHQVDSDDLTIAVNFWWPSKIMLAMQKHMDSYYLRRIISRLVDSEKERMTAEVSVIEHKKEETDKINHNCSANSDVEELKDNFFAGPTLSPRFTDCFTRGMRSMKHEQSPNELGNSLQETETGRSTVAVCSVDTSIHTAIPQEISGSVGKEQNCDTMACQSGDLKPCYLSPTSSGCNLHGVEFKNNYVLQKLNSFESHLLNTLISYVHEKIDSSSIKMADQTLDQKESSASEFVRFHSVSECFHKNYSSGDDIIANILGHLKPATLQKLLLVMVNQFPRTLEALIIHGLSPKAAEILTQKFDEMDKEAAKDEQEEFYRLFYSVFDDHHAAMEVILNGKESFAFLALKTVLERYLGVNCEWSQT